MARGQRPNGEPETRWRQIIQRQAGSGLSVRDFCLRHNLALATFYAWRRNLRQRTQSPPPTFLPVRVQQEQPADEGRWIALDLRGGRVMRLPASTPVEHLAALVRALEQDAGGAS